MNTRTTVLTGLLLLSGTRAYAGEGNNLALVEVPAGTGVYHTMTLVPPSVDTASGKQVSQPVDVAGGKSQVEVPAARGAATGGTVASR